MWHAGYQIYPSPTSSNPLTGPVRTRHVMYMQGFFPRGPSYYHALLAKNLQRHADLYGMDITCSPLSSVEPHLVRCEIAARKQERSVHTTYDFFAWEDIISRAHRRGPLIDIIEAFYSFYVHFADGAVWRMAACRWKYALAWLFPYVLFSGIAVLIFFALRQVISFVTQDVSMRPLLWILADIAIMFGLWRLNKLYWSSLMVRNFNYATAYVKGRKPELDERLDIFADYIARTCRTSKADEILIVGHSFGTVLATMAMERALRHGSLDNDDARVKFLTLGDITCHIGFLKGPAAYQLRQSTLALARQKDLPWVLLYSGKDVLSFNTADLPTAFSAIDEPPGQALMSFNWPLLYDAVFRSAIRPDDYYRFRWRFFHVHSQFIMAAQLKTAHWDYMRAVCGAEPLALSGKRFESPAHA